MRDTGPGRRSVLGIVRGVLRRSAQEKMQRVQADLYASETREMEHAEPYGLTSRAHDGAEVFAAAPGGSRSHLVTLVVADRRYRLTTLAEGEVAIHDDQGQMMVLRRDMVEIVRPNGQIVEMVDEPQRVRLIDGRRHVVLRDLDGVEMVQLKLKTEGGRDDREEAPVHITLSTDGDPITSSHPIVDGVPDPNPED